MQWTLDEVVRVNVYTSTGNMAMKSTIMSSADAVRAHSCVDTCIAAVDKDPGLE